MVGGGSSSMRMVGGTTVSFDPEVLEWKDDGRFSAVLQRRKSRAEANNNNNNHRNGLPSLSSQVQSPPAPSTTASDDSFPAVHRRCASINPPLGWNSSAGRSSAAHQPRRLLDRKKKTQQQQSNDKPISAFGKYFSARMVAEKLARAFHLAPPPKGIVGGRHRSEIPFYGTVDADVKKMRPRHRTAVSASSGGGKHCSISDDEYSASSADSELDAENGTGNAEAEGPPYICCCCCCMDECCRRSQLHQHTCLHHPLHDDPLDTNPMPPEDPIDRSSRKDMDRRTSAPQAPAKKPNAGKTLPNSKRESTSNPQVVAGAMSPSSSSSLCRTQLVGTTAGSLQDRDDDHDVAIGEVSTSTYGSAKAYPPHQKEKQQEHVYKWREECYYNTGMDLRELQEIETSHDKPTTNSRGAGAMASTHGEMHQQQQQLETEIKPRMRENDHAAQRALQLQTENECRKTVMNSKMQNPQDHDRLKWRQRHVQQPPPADVAAGMEEVKANNVDGDCGFSYATDIELEQLRTVCRDQKRMIQELKSALADIDVDLRHQLQLLQLNSSSDHDHDTCINYCCNNFCCSSSCHSHSHSHSHEKDLRLIPPLQSSTTVRISNNDHQHRKDGRLPCARRITNNAPAETSNNASMMDDFDVVEQPASCATSASRSNPVDVNIVVEADDDDTTSISLRKVLDLKQRKQMAPRMMGGRGDDDKDNNNMIAGNGVHEQQQQQIFVAYGHQSSPHPKHSSTEMELDAFKNLRNEISGILKGRAQLQQEAHHLHLALTLTNQRVEELEDQLAQKEKVMQNIYDELEKTRKERDTMQKDAEFMGQEAIRLATQVDRLSKRVEKLDEDVLMKDGQLSILRGALQQCNE